MSGEDNREISVECKIITINSFPKYKNELQKKKLIIVEGKDDLYFINYYLKHLEIMDIEVRPIEGKIDTGNLEPFIKIHRNFRELEGIGFISDADNISACQEYQRLTTVINELNGTPPISGLRLESPDYIGEFSPGPPRIGIYVLPNNSDKGRLEDLFLNCVKNKPGMKCVRPFFECVLTLSDPPKNYAKAKALAFIATQSALPRGVGGAAQHGIWDFDSSELVKLKTFIKKL
jgi:hypothetical protein